MRTYLIILLTFVCSISFGQANSIKFKTQLQRALDGSGNPIENAGILSNAQGKFTIRTLTQFKTVLGLGTYTSGSILFGHTDGSITEDNSNLFYNNSSNKVGIGKTSNLFGKLDVVMAGTVEAISISDVVLGDGNDFYTVYDNLDNKVFGNRLGSLGDLEFHLYSGGGSQERTPFSISPDALDGVLQINPDWIDITNAYLHGTLMDADGDVGDPTQMLTSTGTGTDWQDQPEGSNYWEYQANVFQSGTSAPVVEVLLNTFCCDVNWTYVSTGIYKGTFDLGINGAPLSSYTTIDVASIMPQVPARSYILKRLGGDEFELRTYSDHFVTLANGMINMPVYIKSLKL